MHNARLVCALAFALAAPVAVAQVRPSSPLLTCQAARQIVATEGAAVLSTGRYAYERYVSGSQFCALGETIEPAWIPAADSAQCFVGYRCRQPDLERSDR